MFLLFLRVLVLSGVHMQTAALLAAQGGPTLRISVVRAPRAPNCVGCAAACGYIDEGTALLQLADREHIGRIGWIMESLKGASFLPAPVIISAIWKPTDLAAIALSCAVDVAKIVRFVARGALQAAFA